MTSLGVGAREHPQAVLDSHERGPTAASGGEPALEVRAVALTEADRAARWARGEDVRPLVRSLSAGVVGLGGALAIDWLVPNGSSWAKLGGSLTGTGTTGGLVSVAALAVAVALLYTYGQVRRFLALPRPAGGVVFTLALWLVLGPLLLVRATWVAPEPAAARATLAAAWLLVTETTAGVLWLGCLIGWFCTSQSGDA